MVGWEDMKEGEMGGMLPRLGWLQRHAICAVSQDNTPTPTPITMGPRLGLMLYCHHLEILLIVEQVNFE